MDRHMLQMARKMRRDMALAADDREMDREEFSVALWARDTLWPTAILRWVEAIGNHPSGFESGT